MKNAIFINFPSPHRPSARYPGIPDPLPPASLMGHSPGRPSLPSPAPDPEPA